MPRGPKKHLKRLNAPNHWMLGKLDGIWAPRPSSGPHKLSESLPLSIILRNRLKYALSYKETQMICMEKHVKVDGKVRTDRGFPAGFMDVVQLDATGDAFRLLFDTKGRFHLHRLQAPQNKRVDERNFKLCRVQKLSMSNKTVPYIVTHDGRTIRFADPSIHVNDTVQIDLRTGKITDIIHFEQDTVVMITKGRNRGRVGVIHSIEKHPGSFNIIHIRDRAGQRFATRESNVFVIGRTKADGSLGTSVSLPKAGGLKRSIHDPKARH